jgi:hypothetical protein
VFSRSYIATRNCLSGCSQERLLYVTTSKSHVLRLRFSFLPWDVSPIHHSRCECKRSGAYLLFNLFVQLRQEKAELQEEKTSLETEVGRLQEQRNQSGDDQSSATGWGMDQPGPMTNPQFPYPLVPLMTKSALLPSKDVPPDPNSPFFSAAPFSAFLQPPAYQTHGMFGSRQSPYIHFPHPGKQIHVERPAARYPAPLHPTPVYPAALSKSAQAKASDLPVVGTDLRLQTPGLTASSTIQHSVSDHEQPEKKTSTTAVSFLFSVSAW